MSSPNPDPSRPGLPTWAVDQAADELYDVDDGRTITARAWAIVREKQQRDDERHDEYDDPDQGGEG